jgi:DNA topoisomerase-1
MTKTLVIVESAGKVAKIESLLGNNYKVMASYGHIIDLASGSMSVDIENNFEPKYSVIEASKKSKFKQKSKKDIINDLKKAAKSADEILLASDEDREGEMIAWSLAHVLGLKKPKRITFNAITKSELEKAVKNPREIDQYLVDAQKARRILDRIVGYEISPILWKQIGAQLSAGRVQSVVARLIVDKEREINDFLQDGIPSFFKFNGDFYDVNKKVFNAILYSSKKGKSKKYEDPEEDKEKEETNEIKGNIAKLESETESRKLMKLLSKSDITMGDITEKDKMRNPSAPYSTSTLQQDASTKLGYNVKRTMQAAQNLYEAGYITYMRTDSVNLSKEALDSIGKYIKDKYGKNYHNLRNYTQKKANTQEAHEAVRPSDIFVEAVDQTGKIRNDEYRLYNLIWKRTVASQMAPAKIKEKSIILNISKTSEYYFMTKIESIVFPGYLTLYNIQGNKEDETEETEDNFTESNLGIDIPKKGTSIKVEKITGTQDYVNPPRRFNEATLINKLDPKNLNIGRPATYGPIIEKILEKDYVKLMDIEGEIKESIIMEWDGKKIKETIEKVNVGKEKNRMVPTSLGLLVNDFLMKYFPDIMDYKFTAGMEENLDAIAEGKEKWTSVLKDFYKKFHPIVEQISKLKTTVKDEKNRTLGNHPETNAEIIATIGKYGPMLKMCITKSKCIYAPIKAPLTIESITLEEALILFEFPKNLGKYNGMEIILNKGKFGLYITYGDKKISLNKKLTKEEKEEKEEKEKNKEEKEEKEKNKEDKEEVEVLFDENITFDEAVELIKERTKDILWSERDNKIIYEVREGPYGKYIKITDTASKKIKKSFNVKLPPDTKIEELTLEKIKFIITNNKTNRYAKKDNKEVKENKDNKEVKEVKEVKEEKMGRITKKKYVPKKKYIPKTKYKPKKKSKK